MCTSGRRAARRGMYQPALARYASALVRVAFAISDCPCWRDASSPPHHRGRETLSSLARRYPGQRRIRGERRGRLTGDIRARRPPGSVHEPTVTIAGPSPWPIPSATKLLLRSRRGPAKTTNVARRRSRPCASSCHVTMSSTIRTHAHTCPRHSPRAGSATGRGGECRRAV